MFYIVHTNEVFRNATYVANSYKTLCTIVSTSEQVLTLCYGGIIKRGDHFFLRLGEFDLAIEDFPNYSKYENVGRQFVACQNGAKKVFDVYGPEIIGADFLILLEERSHPNPPLVE